MLKNELITAIADVTGQTKAATEATLKALGSVLHDNLTTPGQKIKVHGVATFEVKVQAARTARNPQTGEPIQLAEKVVVKAKSDI